MRKYFGPLQFFIPAVLVVVFLAFATAPSGAQTLCPTGTGTICVLTWQQDTPSICTGCAYRTGQNLSESAITYSSITTDRFGRLCSVQLDGQVYAQPLVVTNVGIGSTTWPSVVYVVTQNDRLYAIDGNPQDGCAILNGNGSGTSLIPAGQSAVPCRDIEGIDCLAIKPTVGILGTPVISTSGSTGTMYVVTETEDSSGNFYHYLHAIDIRNFTEPSPVRVVPPGSTSGQASAFSKIHIQRPGLLFANCGTGCGNHVYVAFSMIDSAGTPYPNGAIFGYNAADLHDTHVFYLQTSLGTTGFDGGGIWMGGAAPAFGTDSSGQSWIYVTTANGVFDLNTGGTDAGNSLLKLNPKGLAITTPNFGYFTPVDQYYRSPTVPNARVTVAQRYRAMSISARGGRC